MNNNDILIASITNLFRVYIIWRFVGLFFNTRKVSEKIEFSIYIFFYFITLFIFLIFHLPILNVVTNLAALFLIILLYEGSCSKKIVATILIYSINMVCDSLSAFLFMDYDVGEPTSQIFSVVTDLLILICELVASRVLGNKARQEYIKGLKILLVIPVISIFMLCFLTYANLKSRGLLVIESVGILFINIVVFYLYNTLIDTHQQLYEKEVLEQQIKVYSNQLDVITQTQTRIRILRHDMLHHMKELYCLATRNENKVIMKYLDKMEASMVNVKEHVYSGNKDMDGILNYMIEKAKHTLDKVDIQVKIPRDLHSYTFELTVILGNLLENAIEAAKQADEKVLTFKMNVEKGLLFIHVSNQYKGKIKEIDGRIISSKEDKTNHGLGLESVREIVKRYDGAMDMVYDENTFKVDIMLYLSYYYNLSADS